MRFLKLLSYLLLFSYSITAYCVINKLNSAEEMIADSENLIKSCENLDDKECVMKQIASMYETDQWLREKYIKNEDQSLFDLIQVQNKKNTERLKMILNKYFWLRISEFNSEADHQAWLIAQHSDHDLEFQHRVLYILEKMLLLQETNFKNYAYLYDRVALRYTNFGVKQKFGTQATKQDNQFVIRDFEGTESELDERRIKIGLEPIAQYLESLNKLYLSSN